MNIDRTESRSLAVLSWVVLIGALLTVALLAGGIAWVWARSVLTTETFMPEYQRLSLVGRYFYILSAGFFNVTWGLAFVGVVLAWFLARNRGAPARRIALALSLIFVHRWLQLTLLFQLMFSNWKM